MLIIEDAVEYLRAGEKKTENIGVEIEHFVVNEKGNQICFDEITKLIDVVASQKNAKKYITDGYVVGYDTGEYTVTLEPACQFEVSIYPKGALGDIVAIYNEFYSEWEHVFEKVGYQIVTAGNLPIVELGKVTPDEIPLSKKLRYKYMNQYFDKTGRYGKYMMRASGSTQLSIDYSSETDMIRKLRILEIISPIIMIMMENKTKVDSALPGSTGQTHLLRIQEWEDLDPARTGYFPGSFDAEFGYESIARTITNTPLILLTDKEETIYVDDKTAMDLIHTGTVEYDARDQEDRIALLEHFISMSFFHYRIKKYIEIRVADANDIDKSIAFAALIKGLMYSEDSLKKLENAFSHITIIDEIQEATYKVEKDGFDAIIYGNKTAREWAVEIVRIAESAIDDEEKHYLELMRS